VIGGNKFWWGISLLMLIVGSIILLIMIISIVMSCESSLYVGYTVFGLIIGVLIGKGIDKMVDAGSSSEFLEGIKRGIEELKEYYLY